jgi:hypothetical protein
MNKLLTIGSIAIAAALAGPALAADSDMKRADKGPGGQSDTQKKSDYTENAKATTSDRGDKKGPGGQSDTQTNSQRPNNLSPKGDATSNTGMKKGEAGKGPGGQSDTQQDSQRPDAMKR